MSITICLYVFLLKRFQGHKFLIFEMVGELEDYTSRWCLMMCWIRNATTMSWAIHRMALEQEPGRPATPDVRMVAEALAEHGEQLTDAATELLRSLGTQEPCCWRSCQSIGVIKLNETKIHKDDKMTMFHRASLICSCHKFLRFETWPIQNTFMSLYITCPLSSWSLSSIFWTSSITASNIQSFAVRRGSFGLGYSRSRSGRCGSVAGRCVKKDRVFIPWGYLGPATCLSNFTACFTQ